MGCGECGLSELLDGAFCLLLGRPVQPGIVDCPHFMSVVYEGGDRLSPIQHLLLNQEEARARKMRGPV